MSHFRGFAYRALLAGVLFLSVVRLNGDGLTIIGARYVPDVPYPQFVHLWSENWGLRGDDGEPKPYSSLSMPLGSYLHVYLQNQSSTQSRIQDAKLADISLTRAIAFSKQKAARRYPASLRFSQLATNELTRLFSAGEPVWWKAEPEIVDAGSYAEVVIRLRRALTNDVKIEVVTGNGSVETSVERRSAPAFAGLSFGPRLDVIYAYVRRTNDKAARPTAVFLDDQDVTAKTTVCLDQSIEIIPIVVGLSRPLPKGSFHAVKMRFENGPSALAGARAFSDDFVYGMWGYVNQGKTAEERVNYFLGDLARHNVNAVMHSYGNEIGKYLGGEAGTEHSQLTGIRAMRPGPGKDANPLCYFLMDEPDAHDFAVNQLAPEHRLGTLGQDVVRTSREFRRADPVTPQLLNVDNTYKPENWYMYCQLPDIYCADPYFQSQQQIAWTKKPAWAASFLKPAYVYGVSTICRDACAPKPVHIILNAVSHGEGPEGFRYATPEEKTVELFYALAGGATGISYWWYTPYGEFKGCGAKEPGAAALWRQIGLLGAQARTAGPLITRSCPAGLQVKAPPRLWTRTLLSGGDTLILLAVNDNMASDRLGTVVVPLERAEVKLKLPAWFRPADVFEITAEGVKEVSWQNSGDEVVANLGRTRVARMIIFSAASNLRENCTKRYRQQFQKRVTELASFGKAESATDR